MKKNPCVNKCQWVKIDKPPAKLKYEHGIVSVDKELIIEASNDILNNYTVKCKACGRKVSK